MLQENNVKNTHLNLSTQELINIALARNEGELASNEALVVTTGLRTGRSPKDRFIVKDSLTEQAVDWNTINQPLSPQVFDTIWQKAEDHLNQKDISFTSYLTVGAEEKYALPVKVRTELAWQMLFCHNLFIHSQTATDHHPNQWTLLSVPSYKTDPARDGVNSDAVIALNFSKRRVLICGTFYAGEMKKAMFSVLNFLLPMHEVLPMHCAANVGKDQKSALFFGLSGTGKTTLSADPDRFLIGDDEHGWSAEGIFNFEGGCYAKCIDLSKEREPIIWDAIRYGAIAENVVIDPETKIPDYSNVSLTQNTRVAYPREHIPLRVPNNKAAQPHAVLFLTCDLYGVLPPVAKLTKEQAAYYFLSGYTALVGSTEVGQGGGIKPTFSTCFGAPFFSRPAREYADLLIKRLNNSEAIVYLVNTGWTGGAHGEGGSRFSIPATRSIVQAIVNGECHQAEYEILPKWNLAIPTHLPRIDSTLLNPQKTWKDATKYEEYSQLLRKQFIDNFKKFKTADAIRQAGPEG